MGPISPLWEKGDRPKKSSGEVRSLVENLGRREKSKVNWEKGDALFS